MKDLIIKLASGDITLTAAELQNILDTNEEEDVIGMENDLDALFKTKYTGTVSVKFHIRYIKNGSPALTYTKG